MNTSGVLAKSPTTVVFEDVHHPVTGAVSRIQFTVDSDEYGRFSAARAAARREWYDSLQLEMSRG